MQDSKVLARIIGPILIVSATGLLVNLKTYQGLIAEFGRNASLCYLGGFSALVCGLIVVQLHNKWEVQWPLIITILGWIAVIKGAVLIIFPGLILNLWHPFVGTPTPLIVSSVISLVVGVFLTIKGYLGQIPSRK